MKTRIAILATSSLLSGCIILPSPPQAVGHAKARVQAVRTAACANPDLPHVVAVETRRSTVNVDLRCPPGG